MFVHKSQLSTLTQIHEKCVADVRHVVLSFCESIQQAWNWEFQRTEKLLLLRHHRLRTHFNVSVAEKKISPSHFLSCHRLTLSTLLTHPHTFSLSFSIMQNRIKKSWRVKRWADGRQRVRWKKPKQPNALSLPAWSWRWESVCVCVVRQNKMLNTWLIMNDNLNFLKKPRKTDSSFFDILYAATCGSFSLSFSAIYHSVSELCT